MNKLKRLSKTEVEQQIKELFSNPTNEKIKKAKKLACSKNIKLGKLKKIYCKKCNSVFDSSNSEIMIKKGFKIIKCKKCSFLTKWKIF